MPKQTKVCRVCGKTYESCKSIKTGSGVFNWREMCCSPECGQIYFQRVQDARNPAPPVQAKKRYTRRETPVVEEIAAPVEAPVETTVEAPVEQAAEPTAE